MFDLGEDIKKNWLLSKYFEKTKLQVVLKLIEEGLSIQKIAQMFELDVEEVRKVAKGELESCGGSIPLPITHYLPILYEAALNPPHSGRVGLPKQSPFGFASLGDGHRHPQLDSPPPWAEFSASL